MSGNSYKSLKVTEEVFDALTWWRDLFEDPSYSVTLRRLMTLSCNGGIQEIIAKKEKIKAEFKTRVENNKNP